MQNVRMGLAVSETTSAGGAGSGTGAQTAQEKAGQGAAVVTQQASEVTDTVKQQTARVAQEAGAQARQLGTELREQLSDETRAQGERLVQGLRGLADELGRMGEHGQGDSMATTVVRRLAQGGHQVADHVEQRGPGGLMDEIQDFARRRPGLFLVGAALAGFAVGRTGKDVATGSASNGSNGANASGSTADQAARPATPPTGVEVGAGGGTATSLGGYGQPETEPITSPLPGTSGSPLASPGASGQWPPPEMGR